MKKEQLEKLLNDVAGLPPVPQVEATLFNIGGRGYYENPTTDVIAFFCNPDGEHGLGDIMLRALFDAVEPSAASGKLALDASLIKAPQREVATESGKRMDLLLEGNSWVMVVENKIYHALSNPWDDYERYVMKQHPSKERYLVLLSPTGDGAPDGWVGVSYESFIVATKAALADTFISCPLNKWMVLLRDFLLHLEDIMSKRDIPDETIKYVFDHLRELHNAKEIADNAIDQVNEVMRQFLESELSTTVSASVNTWYGYPSLRFNLPEFNDAAKIHIFFDRRKGKETCIRVYLYGMTDMKHRKMADEIFLESDSQWDEQNGDIRCYSDGIKDESIDALQNSAKIKLEKVREFLSLKRASEY